MTVIGGGSSYTPELIDGFIQNEDKVRVGEIVLYDIDQERLKIVGGMAQRMAQLGSWTFDPATPRAVWSLEAMRMLGLAPDAAPDPGQVELLEDPRPRAIVADRQRDLFEE